MVSVAAYTTFPSDLANMPVTGEAGHAAEPETDVASRQDTGVLLAETASTIALTAASDAAASVAP
jgi:hypothetical protein